MVKLSDIYPEEYVAQRTAEFEKGQSRTSNSFWDILAEMQSYGGFEAVKAVLDNYLTLEQANALLSASRKLYASRMYDTGITALAGNSGKHFNSLMSDFLRASR